MTNWRLAEQKSYNHRFTEEAKSRLVGGAETWKGLPHVMGGSRDSGGISQLQRFCLRSMQSQLHTHSAQSTRARKRLLHNTWLWKAREILSTRERQELARDVTEQVGVVHDKLLQKGFPLSVSGGSPPPHTHLLGSKCPPPEDRCLSMPETGEKERNYLKVTQT